VSRDSYRLGQSDATRGKCRATPRKPLFGLAGIEFCRFQDEYPLDFLGDKLFSLADARCSLQDFAGIIHGRSTQNRPTCSLGELFAGEINHESVKALPRALNKSRQMRPTGHGRRPIPRLI